MEIDPLKFWIGFVVGLVLMVLIRAFIRMRKK